MYRNTVAGKLYWDNNPVGEIPRYTYEQIGSKFYYISEDKLYWGKALIMCRQRNGNLVNLKNQEEWKAITAKLNTSRSYWVDYYDIEYLEIFKSALTGKAAQFLKWTNETQTTYHRQLCVELQSEQNHLMHVVDCFDRKYYICEADEAHPQKKELSTQPEGAEKRLRLLELNWIKTEEHHKINEMLIRMGGL